MELHAAHRQCLVLDGHGDAVLGAVAEEPAFAAEAGEDAADYCASTDLPAYDAADIDDGLRAGLFELDDIADMLSNLVEPEDRRKLIVALGSGQTKPTETLVRLLPEADLARIRDC